jgi:hypothetical protein
MIAVRVAIPQANPRNVKRGKWTQLWLSLLKARHAGQAIQVRPMTSREANSALGAMVHRLARHEPHAKLRMRVSGQHSGRPIFWIDGQRPPRRKTR